MNIKAVILSNLGNGKYEIIYDELPDGVFDFDPDSFVVLMHDGSHYELMEDGPGGKAPRYIALPVEIRERLVGKCFFASIGYVPRILTESIPTPPGPDILTEADPLVGDPTPKHSACPTPNRPDSVENGRVVGRTGEGTSAIYFSDCAIAPNSGGRGCFSLCLEQTAVHISYSQRVLLSAAMTAADSELYHAIRTQC